MKLDCQGGHAVAEIRHRQERPVQRPVMQHEVSGRIAAEHVSGAAQAALQVKPVCRRHHRLPHDVGSAKGAEAGPVDGGGKDRRDIVGRLYPGVARSPAKGEEERRGEMKFDGD